MAFPLYALSAARGPGGSKGAGGGALTDWRAAHGDQTCLQAHVRCQKALGVLCCHLQALLVRQPIPWARGTLSAVPTGVPANGWASKGMLWLGEFIWPPFPFSHLAASEVCSFGPELHWIWRTFIEHSDFVDGHREPADYPVRVRGNRRLEPLGMSCAGARPGMVMVMMA
jgi:hypothetical protein